MIGDDRNQGSRGFPQYWMGETVAGGGNPQSPGVGQMAAEFAATGRLLTGRFQTFEAGKIGQARAPGRLGARPPAAMAVPAASTQAAAIASVRMSLTVIARARPPPLI